jgi:hypothetical protein
MRLARPQLHENHVTLVLVLVVAVVSTAALRTAGLVAAVTTGLAYDYFWTEPFHSFQIFDTQDLLTVLLLFLVGAAIEQLSWWGGRQRDAAVRRGDYLNALWHAAEPVARRRIQRRWLRGGAFSGARNYFGYGAFLTLHFLANAPPIWGASGVRVGRQYWPRRSAVQKASPDRRRRGRSKLRRTRRVVGCGGWAGAAISLRQCRLRSAAPRSPC